MSGTLDTLIDPQTQELRLTRHTTQGWPFIQPLFADGGYFPDGLTVTSSASRSPSANETTVTGTTVIDFASFAVEAKFSGLGQDTDLELILTVSLAELTGGGSALSASWQPQVKFKSNRGVRKIELDAARGTLRLCGFDLVATLEMSVPQTVTRLQVGALSPSASTPLEVTMPGPRLVATLKPVNQPLSAFTSQYALGAVGPELNLKELILSAEPWGGRYAVALDVGGHWEVFPGCDLTEIAAVIDYSSGAKTVWATLAASVTLGGVPLQVSAAYDGSVSGWQFEGGIEPDAPLEIGGFIDRLLNELGIDGKCPAALQGATIHELALSFNTVSRAVVVRCATRLALSSGKTLDLTVLVAVEGGRLSFHGTVTLGTLTFDLVFDETDRGRTLVASYSDSTARQVKLGAIIAMVLNEADPNNQTLIDLGNQVSFAIKDALLVYEHRDQAAAAWLLAADVEAGMDFSGLALVGASFPPGQGARLLLQPLITSGGLSASAVSGLVHAGALSLPTPLPQANGYSLTTKVALGTEVIKLSLPVDMSGGKIAHAPNAETAAELTGVSKATEVSEVTQVTQVDNVSWIAVQRAFGPLALERIGVRYDSGALDFLLDAHLSGAGLTLALEGFGAHVKLADPSQVTPILNGIGLDFRSPGLEIGGSLMHHKEGVGADAFDEYVGTAIVKAGALTVDAIGAYRIVDGQPSLFVYAELDYPIGGPAFFFITGLAAAFGYNRSFKVPPIEQLAGFPLLAGHAKKKDAAGASAMHAASDALREYIPAEIGTVFLGIGLKFTSFQTIASSALLTASFGKELAFDLIGRSTLIMPAGASREQAVAVVEMAWLASYRPADGLLALRAQLAPGSYVFSSDCHLAGGFAFYSWFSGDHEGQFVLTAGGYHPGFDLASRPHFPRVPRLSVAWQVSKALSIKGDAYYALTSSAAMAGGHLEMVWEQHPYKAWCKAGIDCLFDWKPLHYAGEAYVELGASYTFELAGTRHITIETGANLTVWGPPFSGRARVNLVHFSFDMVFGIALAKPPPVHLFDDDGQGHGTGFSALLPESNKLCAVSVTGGLGASRILDGKKVWIVNPKALCLVVDSVIPSKHIHVRGMLRDPEDETSDAPLRFGISPMAMAYDAVTSETTITITKVGDPGWTPEHLQYRLRQTGYPSALWGEPKKATAPGKLTDEKLIEALAGVQITPKRVADRGAHFTWPGVDLFERHRPMLRDGIYDIEVTQHLSASSSTEAHTAACCKPLEAKSSLRFEVAGEEFSLPASCIHSVFPPKGSLGDHSTSLPQIILERSTLPWERSADATDPNTSDADKHSPWVALLVFDGEKKATSDGPRDGLPGPAKITVDATALPTARELELLCHVRVAHGPGGAGGRVERAVVIANRAPSVGKLSTVHLVSMRGIEVVGAQRRLVSLWSWSFSCPSLGAGFKSLMQQVNRLPFAPASVRLGHSLANGKRAEAAYHGPFVPMSRGPVGEPGHSGNPLQLPDISQLAALELGRLLALQNKSVSVGLLRLKRSLAHEARHESQRKAANHVYPRKLPPAEMAATAATAKAAGTANAARPSAELLLPAGLRALLTPELACWIAGLVLLEDVPFRYILPDENQLPKESMRSFELDEEWITNLLVGALGVGGAWRLAGPAQHALPEFEAAVRVDAGPVGKGLRPFGAWQRVTGVVLRSQLVSGWPAMSIYADGKREPLVCRRLSKNILLALFKGAFETVDFRLPQETLHFESNEENKPIPKNWLADAKTSVQLGQHVHLAKQENVRCTF